MCLRIHTAPGWVPKKLFLNIKKDRNGTYYEPLSGLIVLRTIGTKLHFYHSRATFPMVVSSPLGEHHVRVVRRPVLTTKPMTSLYAEVDTEVNIVSAVGDVVLLDDYVDFPVYIQHNQKTSPKPTSIVLRIESIPKTSIITNGSYMVGAKGFILEKGRIMPLYFNRAYKIQRTPHGLRLTTKTASQEILVQNAYLKVSSLGVHVELRKLWNNDKPFVQDDLFSINVLVPLDKVQLVGDYDLVTKEVIIPTPEYGSKIDSYFSTELYHNFYQKLTEELDYVS